MLLMVVFGGFLVAVLINWYFEKRKSNCFLKMVCTGKPIEQPLSDEEVHEILRHEFRPAEVLDQNWDAIVIGSGLSGLTLSKILSAAGRKVLVLEQHDTAGGCCHNFELDRFEFDVGVHYVQDMKPGKELYIICSAITDSQLEWNQLEDPVDVTIVSGKKYGRKSGKLQCYQAQLEEWFPEEAEKIKAFFNYANTCMKQLPWLFRAKFMPRGIFLFLMKTGIFPLITDIFSITKRTLLEVMQEYKLSADLQVAISYYFVNYAVPPQRASFLQHIMFFLDDGFFPVGGSTSITSPIIRSIKKFGGKVLVKAYVKQITFENGHVSGVIVNYGPTGHFIPSQMVISTASSIRTLNDMIPMEIREKSRYYQVLNNLFVKDSVKVAALQGYIGLSASKEDLNLPSNNYFWFKSNDFYEFDHYLSLTADEVLDYGCPPILYISFPSSKDPKWEDRHGGSSTCQIIAFCNPEWFEQFKDTSKVKSQKRINEDEYVSRKNYFGEMMIEKLIELFPKLKTEIVFSEFSTSLSQQYYMQNVYGEIYSLTHQSDRFHAENWCELRHKTDIPGLYLSGQDMLFCGISSALHNGLLTAGVILNRDLYADLNYAYKVQQNELQKYFNH